MKRANLADANSIFHMCNIFILHQIRLGLILAICSVNSRAIIELFLLSTSILKTTEIICHAVDCNAIKYTITARDGTVHHIEHLLPLIQHEIGNTYGVNSNRTE